MNRTARIERTTQESQVEVEVDLDGTGRSDVSTGVGFYDHMLDAFARHALLDLVVHTSGDTHIDAGQRHDRCAGGHQRAPGHELPTFAGDLRNVARGRQRWCRVSTDLTTLFSSRSHGCQSGGCHRCQFR